MSRLLIAVAMAAAGIAAGAQITTAYAGRAALGAVVAAGDGAALIWLLTRGHRAWHPPASIAGLVGLVAGLQHRLPAPDGLLDAVGHAGARLLTIAPPIPSRMDTLLLPVAATWICVASGCALAHGRRPAAAMVPPALLVTGMLVLVGPRHDGGYGWVAVLVAALCAVLAAGHAAQLGSARPAANRDAARSGPMAPVVVGARRRPLARLGVTTAIAVLLAGLSGVATPMVLVGVGTTPPDLRSVLLPPVQAPTEVHPLSLLARWQANPELPLFTVDGAELVPLRWAVLSDFDGVSWQPAALYRAAGGDRHPRRPAEIAVRDLQATVTVLGLTGSWLPVPDGLRRVSGVPVAVDDEESTFVVSEGLRPGQTYQVLAAVPQPTPEQLALARLPLSSDFDRYRQLPPGDVGPIVQLALDAAGDGLPHEQAMALAAWLRSEYRYDPLAPGGSGYPSINRFLTADPGTGGGRGTWEQFAAAYAVLARALGIPARVVVGFVPPAGVGGSGPTTVTAADARAWPEIYLEPVGWVAVDVTASAADPAVPPVQPRSTGSAASPSTYPTPAPAVASPRAPTAAPSSQAAPGGSPSPGWWASIGLLTALVGAALVGGGVVVARRWRSRRRLTGTDPPARVRGAWAELLDGARLAGLRLEPQWTVSEVVAAVGRAVGSGSGQPLVAVVNRVAFASGSAGAVDGSVGDGSVDGSVGDVDLAVTQARDLVRRARQRAGPIRRLLWWLDPRPL